jgi:hypothetical protein
MADQLQITIEKNVPIPTDINKRGYVQKALAPLQVGDSFVFDDASKNMNQAVTLRVAAKSLGIKLTVRKVKGTQFRAWRIE